MINILRKHYLITSLVSALIALAIWMIWQGFQIENLRHTEKIHPVGSIVDEFNGVPVYSNGKSAYSSHGKHFAADGYYYGHQWQCVEFVKRYYYDHFNHAMPDGWGHARSFYDPSVADSKLNPTRGLIQFNNGGHSKPEPGDMLVYVYGQYGHVSIVSQVNDNSLEIVQQNVYGCPRDTIQLSHIHGQWRIEHEKIAGWLRMPSS